MPGHLRDMTKQRYRKLEPGDTAPHFKQRTRDNPRFVFDSAAGRWLVLGLFGFASSEIGKAATAHLSRLSQKVGLDQVALFGVTTDPEDETRLQDRLPTMRYFRDSDLTVSRLYGSAPLDASTIEPRHYLPRWIILDPMMRVHQVLPMTGREGPALEAAIDALPSVSAPAGLEIQAPVLFLPQVFEPEFCQALIAAYGRNGRDMSGFMQQEGERTVLRHDPAHKRRRDHDLEDAGLIDGARNRIRRRILPQIEKAYQFKVTRMERYLVACYAADDSGHFRAHRDNTTLGTAHRRFAVSINLNADFEGGEIGFPEYGARTFKPPIGGAVVFSCSLLHAVSAVTAGRRFAFLPFLYDDAAARIREANLASLELEGGPPSATEDGASGG